MNHQEVSYSPVDSRKLIFSANAPNPAKNVNVPEINAIPRPISASTISHWKKRALGITSFSAIKAYHEGV